MVNFRSERQKELTQAAKTKKVRHTDKKSAHIRKVAREDKFVSRQRLAVRLNLILACMFAGWLYVVFIDQAWLFWLLFSMSDWFGV